MAATIARVRGFKRDGSPQSGEATRLGHGAVEARVATWRTFVDAHITKDGRVKVTITRDNAIILEHEVEAEGAE